MMGRCELEKKIIRSEKILSRKILLNWTSTIWSSRSTFSIAKKLGTAPHGLLREVYTLEGDKFNGQIL